MDVALVTCASDLVCSPFPEAGAGPALLIAARDHGHAQGRNRTPQEGGAGPALAAPLLRKLFSFSLFTWVVWKRTDEGAFS